MKNKTAINSPRYKNRDYLFPQMLMQINSFCILHSTFCIFLRPANCRILGVNRSATGRIAPPRAGINTVLYDAWNGRIAARKRQHLALSGLVVLRIVFNERNAFVVVMIQCLPTVWTARLCVYD